MNQENIKKLFEQMKHYDSDNRFMAASGLTQEMLKENCQMNEFQKESFINLLLESFHDKTQEVQTNSVRCISSIIGKLNKTSQENIITKIMEVMTAPQDTKKEAINLLDIYATCFKTIIQEYKPEKNDEFIFMIADKLLIAIQKADVMKKEIFLEIACEMFHKNIHEFKLAPSKIKREKYMEQMINALDSAAWRKATQCLGMISPLLTQQSASTTVNILIKKLTNDKEKLIPLLCLSAISANSAPCFIPSLNTVIPTLMDYCRDIKNDKFDILVANCNKADAAMNTMLNLMNKIPKEMEQFTNKLMNLAMGLINFDPGYDESAAMQEDVDMEGWGGDVDQEVNNNDDDMSWKVRKESLKIIESIAKLHQDEIKAHYSDIVHSVSARLNERDDGVKKEVVNAFSAVIKSSVVESVDAMSTQSISSLDSVMGVDIMVLGRQKSSFKGVESQLPDILHIILTMVKDKKTETKILGLKALNAVTVAYSNVVLSNTEQIIPVFESVIKEESITGSIECLIILKAIFKGCIQPTIFHKHLKSINDMLIKSFQSKQSKIIYEALKVTCEYVRILNPMPSQPLMPEVVKFAEELLVYIEKYFSGTELELSVKDISGISMAYYIKYCYHTISDNKMNAILTKYKEKLESESTRIHALKSLNVVIQSLTGNVYDKAILSIIPEVSCLLKQTSRRFRLLSSQLLLSIHERFPSLMQQKSKDFIEDIMHSPLEEDLGITDSIFHLVILLLPHVSKELSNSIYCICIKMLKNNSIRQEEISLLADMFGIIAKTKSVDEIFKEIMADIATSNLIAVSHCIGTLCNKFESKNIISQSLANIISPSVDKTLKKLSLYIIGEIGIHKDFSKDNELVTKLFKLIETESEEIKSICAMCIGRIAIGNPTYFQKIIFEKVKDKKLSYLMLIAIREIIITNSAVLEPFLEQIMKHIQEAAEESDQGKKIIIAEIIGKLYMGFSTRVSKWVTDFMKSQNSSISSTFLLSFKYATTRNSNDYIIINTVVPQIISIVNDSKLLDIKEAAFTSLATLSHNCQSILTTYAPQLNLLIERDAVINQALIQIIDLGPFKITEDKGAPLRKQVLSLLQVMINKCNDKVDYKKIFDRVVEGLSDGNEDCQSLCYQLITQFVYSARNFLVEGIDKVAEAMKKLFSAKVELLTNNKSVENCKEKITMIGRTLAIFEKTQELDGIEKMRDFIGEFKKEKHVACMNIAQ